MKNKLLIPDWILPNGGLDSKGPAIYNPFLYITRPLHQMII
jgi:hypothetical protein